MAENKRYFRWGELYALGECKLTKEGMETMMAWRQEFGKEKFDKFVALVTHTQKMLNNINRGG